MLTLRVLAARWSLRCPLFSLRSARASGLAVLIRVSGVGRAGRAVRVLALPTEGARIGGVSERKVRLQNENRPVFVGDRAGAWCGSCAYVLPDRHHAARRPRCDGRRGAGRPEQAQAVRHKRRRSSGYFRSHPSTPEQDLQGDVWICAANVLAASWPDWMSAALKRYHFRQIEYRTQNASSRTF